MSAVRRYLIAGLVIGLTLLVSAVIIRATDSDDNGSTGQAVAETQSEAEAEAEAEAEEEGGPRAGIEEAQEEAEVTASRLEALHAAQAAGKFGSKVAATTSPATGWVGSRVLSSTFDDWEPAVATDPKAPYVYLLTTRYGTRECGSHCPTPFIPITVSKDGGATWSPQVPICECLRSRRSTTRPSRSSRTRARSTPPSSTGTATTASRPCSRNRPTTAPPGRSRCTSTATFPGRTSRRSP